MFVLHNEFVSEVDAKVQISGDLQPEVQQPLLQGDQLLLRISSFSSTCLLSAFLNKQNEFLKNGKF